MRLTFLGVEIRAVHEGVVNTVLVGLRGLVGQLYREDNAHKIRRGMVGRVGQGLRRSTRINSMRRHKKMMLALERRISDEKRPFLRPA